MPVLFYYWGMTKVKEHLEEVQVGDAIFVVDSEKNIVEVRHPNEKWVWEDGMRVRKGKGNMRDVKLPPPLDLDFDPVDYLLEDRYGRRDAVDDIVDEFLERSRIEKQ